MILLLLNIVLLLTQLSKNKSGMSIFATFGLKTEINGKEGAMEVIKSCLSEGCGQRKSALSNRTTVISLTLPSYKILLIYRAQQRPV